VFDSARMPQQALSLRPNCYPSAAVPTLFSLTRHTFSMMPVSFGVTSDKDRDLHFPNAVDLGNDFRFCG
jgi:hypothetical protein